jgi:hypothetical protein
MIAFNQTVLNRGRGTGAVYPAAVVVGGTRAVGISTRNLKTVQYGGVNTRGRNDVVAVLTIVDKLRLVVPGKITAENGLV